MQPQKPQMDNDVINLAKAIRQTESGGDFNAKGKSEESGAYQWTPNTWKAHAKQALGDENAEMSPSNQNAVAYTVLKSWKDQGLNPAQIAAKWNSGSESGWENKVGTNKFGVQYDVPKYVKSVTDAYQVAKKGGMPSQDPNNPSATSPYQTNAYQPPNAQGTPTIDQNPEPQQQGLGANLQGRAMDASNAISDSASGKINPLSGAIRTAGAVGGSIGDVFDAGLKSIPVVGQAVQGAEDLIGKGIEKFAGTETGKGVVAGMQNFSQAHPELSGDISAGIDAISAIPILKGVGVAKGIVQRGTTNVFKGSIEKTVTDEMRQGIQRTVPGRNALQNAKNDPVKTLVDGRYLPNVTEDANGVARYSTADAHEKIDDAVDKLEEQLQQRLQSAPMQKVASYESTEALRKEALEQVRKEFAKSGESASAMKTVNRIFNDFKSNYGDAIPSSVINDLKRGIRKKVNFNSPDADVRDANVRYHIGQVFMKKVEEIAKSQGIKDVPELNGEMGRLLEAQKVLKLLENKSIPDNPGWRTMIQRRGGDTGTIVGEAVGQSFGLPGVGAVLGRGITNRAIGGSKGKALQSLKSLDTKKKSSRVGKLAPLVPILQQNNKEDRTRER